jgi:hypothetical protein
VAQPRETPFWRLKAKSFFFEKKNQKTFAYWRVGSGELMRRRADVFFFLALEKKTSPCLD